MFEHKDTLSMMRSQTSLEQIEALSCAIALIQFGGHKSTITSLTGLTDPTVTRLASSLKHGIDGAIYMRTGRLPVTLNEVVANPRLLIEASYFYYVYLNCLAHEGKSITSAQLHTPSLIRAFGASKAMFEGAELLLSQAHLTIRLAHTGMIQFIKCASCCSDYIHVLDQNRPTTDCPVCRRNATISLHGASPVDKTRRDIVAKRLENMPVDEHLPTFRTPRVPTVFGTREQGSFKPPR